MLLATVYEKANLSRALHLQFPLIPPLKDTQDVDQETEVLSGEETCPKPQSWWTAELAGLTPQSASLFVHCARYLMTKIHKDLRPGNQDDNIPFGLFGMYPEPCTC